MFGAVVDLVAIMNRPQRDARMIKEAGISLDRALFPLLVAVGRFGPIGVVELGDRAGRDYTTVSRQVAKLESLGFVERRAVQADRRVRELLFPTSLGDVPIRTHSSRDATRLSEYLHDRDRLLQIKMSAADFESKWRGVRVASRELFADTVEIFRMENAGILPVQSLYASTIGAR